MLAGLEALGSIGLVHNDLKLENIIVGDQQSSQESLGEIKIIDFGLTTSVYDKDMNHVKQTTSNEHCYGNFAFSSMHVLAC